MTIKMFDSLNVHNGVISNMNKMEKNYSPFQRELLEFSKNNPEIMDFWKVLTRTVR